MKQHTTDQRRFVNKLLLLASLVFSVGIKSTAQTWVPVATSAPHYNAGVMVLLTDGTVLCKTSSGASLGFRWDKLTPDINGSYINGTWSTIAPMADDRLYFSSEVLRDGRLYVAGGEYGSGGDHGEVYDPLTNVWTPTPDIISGLPGISDANSELLPDGKVLQAVVSSGTKLNYIWDPATNTYTPTANCLRTDNEASWVKLPDESILFIDNYGTTSERYIPSGSGGTWINDGTVPVAIYDPYGKEAGGGFLLPDGRVYFLGAKPRSAYYTPSGSAASGVWATGPNVPDAMGAPDAASAMMVDGKILMALSPEPRAGDHFPDSTIFMQFDYTTNTYTAVGAPGVVDDTIIQPCYYTNMLCLPDGNILFANQGDDQYYEFVPGSAPLAAGKPTITSVIENTCSTFTITGTLFNGISEGACYGDDWQNFTNYPIIRLRSGANVYYARSYNWNSTGVMRGAKPDTAQFSLPAGLPDGPYSLEVVVNGNPSAAYALTVGKANITPATATICQGNTTTLSASIGLGGTWSSSNSSLAAIGSTTGVVTGNGGGTATITYNLGTCISTASVTVRPLPAAITPVGTISICMGSSATLSNATLGGLWSSSDNTVATITTGGIVNSVATGTSTISYTAGGCSVTSPAVINPVPGSIAGTKGVCVGFTTALSCPGAGTWASSNTSVATIGTSSGIVSGVAAGTSRITYTLSTGCISVTTVTVGSTTTPVLGASVVCVGGTTTFSNATPAGSWSSSNTAVATIGSASGIANSTAVGTTMITYALGAGCYSTKVLTVSLSFAIVPSVTLATSPGTTLCGVSSPVTFVPSPINGGSAPTYKWYVNGSSVATGGSYSYTPSGSDVVKCVLRSNASCAYPDTAFASVTMLINPILTPSVSIAVAPGNPLCAGKMATFTATPVSGGVTPKYLWTKNSVAVGAGSVYAYTPANGDLINCTLTSDYACVTAPTVLSNQIIMSVTAPSVNSITIKVTRPTIAAGQLDTFIATAPHAGVAPVYQWYLNGIALPGETKATYITNKLTSGDIVKCSVISSEDCVSPEKAVSGGISIKVNGGTGGVSVKQIENTAGGFTLTPNPNKGLFTISGALKNTADAKVNIVVTNIVGQAVYKETFMAANGNVDKQIALQDNLANGTYMVSMTTGDQHIVFHVVIDK